VTLHYDDSSDDDASLAWFQDPHCSNGYTWLVLDEGRVIELADPAYRTPHAGPCLTPRANSVFYGIAAATNGVVPATRKQEDAIVELCTALFHYHGWKRSDVRPRIVGHDAQAIWTVEQTRLAGIPDGKARLMWGKLGRKIDPTGQRVAGGSVRHAPFQYANSSCSASSTEPCRQRKAARYARHQDPTVHRPKRRPFAKPPAALLREEVTAQHLVRQQRSRSRAHRMEDHNKVRTGDPQINFASDVGEGLNTKARRNTAVVDARKALGPSRDSSPQGLLD
jgi:hypothetical protein